MHRHERDSFIARFLIENVAQGHAIVGLVLLDLGHYAVIAVSAYVAIRLVGTRHGLLITALLGGIVSSTAMTVTLARLGRAATCRPSCGILMPGCERRPASTR